MAVRAMCAALVVASEHGERRAVLECSQEVELARLCRSVTTAIVHSSHIAYRIASHRMHAT